jgi:hypothetical protein
MSNAAEDLAVKHQQARDDAMRDARQAANEIITLVYETRDVNGFKAMEIGGLMLKVNRLAELQKRVREEDLAYHQQFNRATLG